MAQLKLFDNAFYRGFADVDAASAFPYLNTVLWFLFLREAENIDEAKENIKNNFFRDSGDCPYFIGYGRPSKSKEDKFVSLDSPISKFIKQRIGVSISFVIKHGGGLSIGIESDKTSFLFDRRAERIVACYLPYMIPSKRKTDDMDEITSKIISGDADIESLSVLVKKEEDRLNIQEIISREAFKVFCNNRNERTLAEVQRRLATKRMEIQRQISALTQSIDQERDLEEQYEQLSLYNKDDMAEKLQKFFAQRKNIIINDITRTSITYTVHETLSFWNIDSAKRILETNQIDDPKVRFALQKILVDCVGKIHFFASFNFSNLSSILCTQRDIYKEGFEAPHPHLIWYGCLGENQGEVVKYLADNKWDMAIEQTVAATKNINLGDATVMNKFWTWLKNNKDIKFISYKDKFYSINDFYEEVRDNGEKN